MPVPPERRVVCYPPLPIAEMIQGYAKVNEVSESSAVTQALQGFFNKLPADQKMRIVNAAKELKRQQTVVGKNSY